MQVELNSTELKVVTVYRRACKTFGSNHHVLLAAVVSDTLTDAIRKRQRFQRRLAAAEAAVIEKSNARQTTLNELWTAAVANSNFN